MKPPLPSDIEKHFELPLALHIVAYTLTIISQFAAFYSLYAVIRKKFYKRFRLIAVHTFALLIRSMFQILIWPAIKYSAHQTLVCRIFLFGIYSASTLANNASGAMVFWYMLFNKSIYQYREHNFAVSLTTLNRETAIYFIGTYAIAAGLSVNYFFKAIGSEILSNSDCLTVAFYDPGNKSQLILIQFPLYAPLYVPLIFGVLWFILSRTKWKLNADEVPRDDSLEGDFRMIHNLFYWLTWSLVLTQLPSFFADSIPGEKSMTYLAQYFSMHVQSLQNLVDAVIFHLVILRPTARQRMHTAFVKTSMESADTELLNTRTSLEYSYVDTYNLTSYSQSVKNTTDLAYSPHSKTGELRVALLNS